MPDFIIKDKFIDFKKIEKIDFRNNSINLLFNELLRSIKKQFETNEYFSIGIWIRSLHTSNLNILLNFFNIIMNNDKPTEMQKTIKFFLIILLEIIQYISHDLSDSLKIKLDRIKYFFILIVCETISRTNKKVLLDHSKIDFNPNIDFIILNKNKVI